MGNESLKKLIGLQKGELVGVQIYRQLAKIANDPQITQKLLQISNEEYAHSQALQKLTKTVVKGNGVIGKMMGVMKALLGMKKVLEMTAKGQFDTAQKYEALVDQFPTLAAVAQQEKAHGNLLEQLAQK
ncbi:ferritin family protein [Lactiplantibacillus pingfangensis]|uniref:ferritin family protein n=1 Tax=Lactiplantibacillus pingfangensis TaxID=2559915 RepID=UPI0010F7D1B9|nr:ferritin family protein [Lactiplantibacillus pingfangensis]